MVVTRANPLPTETTTRTEVENPASEGVVPLLEMLVQVELVAFIAVGKVPETEASTGFGISSIGAKTRTMASQPCTKRRKAGRCALATRQYPATARNFVGLSTL